MSQRLICVWCRESVSYSRFFDDWYCAACRSSDVRGADDDSDSDDSTGNKQTGGD